MPVIGFWNGKSPESFLVREQHYPFIMRVEEVSNVGKNLFGL